MHVYLHVCVGKNGQETLVHFGGVNWKVGGQEADGDFIVHPLYTFTILIHVNVLTIQKLKISNPQHCDHLLLASSLTADGVRCPTYHHHVAPCRSCFRGAQHRHWLPSSTQNFPGLVKKASLLFFLFLSIFLLGTWFTHTWHGGSGRQKSVLRVVWQTVVHSQTWG